MNMKTVVAGVFALAAALLPLSAAPAQAASNPCGGPYQTIAYVDGRLPGDSGNDDGDMVAYAGGTGYLCVVFYNGTPGGANEMYFNVCPGKTSGSGCGTDHGDYATYAGPIRITDTGCFTAAYMLRNEKDTTWLINGKRSYGPRC
ncbi:hypothetical protein [Streptomyces sp. SID5789]|uniref:hypothetical protein n=1 Tax=Streptomyces sp. SID5789 TaxID=2690310 RepID=UPI00136E56F6|nr:hypothetical protein [Streptomyces sp. SID5789]MZE74499.1 hypothetical protein [Streptomyces sp. SID5789]